jgi:NAD+ synthase (glutamine-hydrolysing)
MKIALGQIDVKAGQPEVNVENMKKFISQAKKQDCDIVAFPELSVSGYLVGDLWTDDDWCEYCMSFNEILQQESSGVVLVYGNVWMDIHDELCQAEDGRKVRINGAYLFQNKKKIFRGYDVDIIKSIQAKTNLPNYRYFDDKRYFVSSEKISVLSPNMPFELEIKDEKVRLGLEICEDCWDEDYETKPTTNLAEAGSDIIINISASPWTYGKDKTRDRVVKNALSHSDNVPIFCYLNAVGSQNSGKNILVFNGATTVYGKDREPKILANSQYREQLLIFDTENIPEKTAIRTQFSKIHEKYEATIRGIKHIIEVTGIDKFVQGVSGGLDSSVSTVLLYAALGKSKAKENLITVNMPSKYNSEATKTSALKLALALNLKQVCQPIEKIYREVYNALSQMAIMKDGNLITDLVEENIQAKIRGTDLLSNFAQMMGALMVNNGNKVEMAIGYCTMYGDMNGSFAVICDLTKAEICDMARYINNERYHREIIPNELIPDENYQFKDEQIVPSAELKNDQKDPILIGWHCALIEQFMDYKKKSPNHIMQWWLDGTLHTKLNISKKLMEIYNVNKAEVFLKDLKWFYGKMRSSVFKRVQCCPIICLSKTSFGGSDLRETILPPNNNIFNKKLEQLVLKKETY